MKSVSRISAQFLQMCAVTYAEIFTLYRLLAEKSCGVVEKFQSVPRGFTFARKAHVAFLMYALCVVRGVSIDLRPFTHFNRVLIRVEDESGIDDFPWQWENVERPVNEMVPVPGDVQATQLVVTARLVLD